MSDLYIATRSDRPDIVKVGRSNNPHRRCATLSACHCFVVQPMHIYKGYGGHETRVHGELARFRLTGGSGREWFAVSLDVAKSILDHALCVKGDFVRPGVRRMTDADVLAEICRGEW